MFVVIGLLLYTSSIQRYFSVWFEACVLLFEATQSRSCHMAMTLTVARGRLVEGVAEHVELSRFMNSASSTQGNSNSNVRKQSICPYESYRSVIVVLQVLQEIQILKHLFHACLLHYDTPCNGKYPALSELQRYPALSSPGQNNVRTSSHTQLVNSIAPVPNTALALND